MRIFLGIKVPEATKKLIQKSIVPLQQKYYTSRWVEPKDFYISVTFLGEVANYKKFYPRIERAIFDIKPFQLELHRGGIFQRDSLILHIECFRQKNLEKTAEELNLSLLQRPLDYRYIPHITIGKARNPSKQQYLHMKKMFQDVDFDHSFLVSELTLFKSELKGGSSPTYEELETFKLQE